MTEEATPASETDPNEGTWQQIVSLIMEMAPLRVEEWSRDTHLVDELGYNSITAMELVFEVEHTLDCDPVPDDLALDVESVGHLADALRAHVERSREHG